MREHLREAISLRRPSSADFPEETAAHALWLLAGRKGLKRTKRTRHAGLHIDQPFVDKYIPDWSALVMRARESA